MHKKLCFCIFFVISSKKVWQFAYLVFFPRINFRKFALAKNFAGINFREIAQNSRMAKITSRENYFFEGI